MVEASRARERFALVTDNRETLADALEENDGAGMTAMEAVGEDATAGAPAAAIGFLHGLRDDWRALVAGAEAENSEPSCMEGYARIVTGVGALADRLDLPVELAAFVAEVRGRDAEIVERRREELAFVQKADMHCRKRPLLKWAAEARGQAVSVLPEHAEWLADGEALAETGRRLQKSPGIVDRIAAALQRIVRSFRLDEAERFREAVVRHEVEARAADVDPRHMAGADELAEQARALGDDELSRSHPPDGRGVERREGVACSRNRAAGGPGTSAIRGGGPPHRRVPAGLPRSSEPARRDRPRGGGRSIGRDAGDRGSTGTGELRRDGLRMLGEGESAKLRRSGTDPARRRGRC